MTDDHNKTLVTFDEFLKIDIRVGRVVEAAPFPEARKPALKLVIDFGTDIGLKKSSAQITEHYNEASLVGRQVMAVVNFPPRQVTFKRLTNWLIINSLMLLSRAELKLYSPLLTYTQ